MKLIYWDYTPRWVPFVAALLIVAGTWLGGTLNNFGADRMTVFAIYLSGALVVLIFFQGRYYWKGQIAKLSGDGMRYEAVTSIWAGPGRRIAFAPTEAKGWTATASSTRNAGGAATLSTVKFTVRGQKLEMSFLNPKLVDLAVLSGINPAYFAKLRKDYPGLKSIS